MSRRLVGLLLLFVSAGFWLARPVRAGDMELLLTRLSEGDCRATLGPGALALRSGQEQALRADERAFRQLAMQVGGAIAPIMATPSTTLGPIGLELSLQNGLTDLERDAAYWQRASRGPAGTAATCEGRHEDVQPLLLTQRLRIEKGLPFGVSLAALFGVVHGLEAYVVGGELRFAVLEDVWRSRIPDLSLQLAATHLLRAEALELTVITLASTLSERYVVQQTLELSPFVGAEAVWTRAASRTVDLTPNIDALACRVGADALCNAAGLGASGDDLGHDVRFERASLLRYRAHVGGLLRYRRVALSAAFSSDLVRPRLGDHGRGGAGARQWTVALTPAIAF